jgi:hypothetical protein
LNYCDTQIVFVKITINRSMQLLACNNRVAQSQFYWDTPNMYETASQWLPHLQYIAGNGYGT